jgi:hypothetical protein
MGLITNSEDNFAHRKIKLLVGSDKEDDIKNPPTHMVLTALTHETIYEARSSVCQANEDEQPSSEKEDEKKL